VYIEDRSTRQLVHRFTYEFDQARVTRIKREMFGRPTTSGNVLVPRPEEEVTIRFRTIRFVDELNSTEFTDEWSTAVDVPVPELEQAPTEDVPDEEAGAVE
jgi:type VI protein secretion system component Hcp